MVKNLPPKEAEWMQEIDPWVRKIPGEGNTNTLQYSCLENPRDRGSWRATFHRVAKSQTRQSSWTCTRIHASSISQVNQCFAIRVRGLTVVTLCPWESSQPSKQFPYKWTSGPSPFSEKVLFAHIWFLFSMPTKHIFLPTDTFVYWHHD